MHSDLSGVNQNTVSWGNQMIHLKCEHLIQTEASIHAIKACPPFQHGSIFAGLRTEVENKCVNCQSVDHS